MKMGLMPRAMWAVFEPSFAEHLVLLGVTDSKNVMNRARRKYDAIIAGIPQFGRDDALLINLISAATFAAVYLSLDEKPSLEMAEQYYDASMSGSSVMRLFLRSSNYYSQRYQRRLAALAERSQKSTNPYSWKFSFRAGPSLDSFDAIFDRCGICTLFSAQGAPEIIPALCAYDYGMAKWTHTQFSRKYTLAGGGPVCDCHYQRVACFAAARPSSSPRN